MKRLTIITTLLMVSWMAAALGKNVDLVTLPKRESVQLTIYNSEDITLVKETRYITLKKGENLLQFSWAGTLIDPTSVELRPLEQEDKVELAHTIFPGQKPQHLIWNIQSQAEGQVKVEISYFTSGLTWTMDYVAITDPDETAMKFRGYVRVFNNSGEEYENAQIRLIVGTINLVEKIADLARRRGMPVPRPAEDDYRVMKREAARKSFALAERAGAAPPPSSAMPSKPRQIVKEGVSEYFMFSVEGTETIPTSWAKRMIAFVADGVKFDIVYRIRGYQYGPRPVRFFLWNNDDEHKLGQSPMPNGLVRIFRDNGKDGLSYLGEKLLRYVPIKAEIEVNLGPDDLVVYDARKMSTQRLRFSFARDSRGNEYVTGWDEKQIWNDTVRNYRTKPIVFELRRIWPGDVDYASEVKTTLFDYRTTETKFTVGARGKTIYPCATVLHQGSHARQARVKL